MNDVFEIYSDEDIEKVEKFLKKNKIKYRKGDSYYLTLVKEAEFRLGEMVDDMYNSDISYLIDNNKKVNKFINDYKYDLADEMYEGDTIFDNEECISTSEDFLDWLIDTKKRVKVKITKK